MRFRDGEKPGALQGSGGGQVVRPPDDPVAPAVDRGTLLARLTPGGQSRDDLAEGLGRLQAQGAGELLEITFLNGAPELLLHRVGGGLRLGLRCVKPVTAALEGVRGQVDAARGQPGEGGRPVHRDATRPCLAEGDVQAVQAALAPAQGADDHGVGAGGLHGLGDRHGQHRVRAHLQEGAMTLRDQRGDHGLQQYGLTQVAVPVAGIRLTGADPLPVTVDRNGTDGS